MFESKEPPPPPQKNKTSWICPPPRVPSAGCTIPNPRVLSALPWKMDNPLQTQCGEHGLWSGRGGWDGMGVCPTPARHVARPTLCVSGLCHRLPRAGLGATQTTTDPIRDWRVKFPYPHSLGTLVGVTSGASGPRSGRGGGGNFWTAAPVPERLLRPKPKTGTRGGGGGGPAGQACGGGGGSGAWEPQRTNLNPIRAMCRSF